MNDSAKRREELLRNYRKSSLENPVIPAIHPRHKNIYNELYPRYHKNKDGSRASFSNDESTFFVRFIIAFLLFLCFVWFDSGNKSILEINSTDIISQIEHQIQIEEFSEVWNEL